MVSRNRFWIYPAQFWDLENDMATVEMTTLECVKEFCRKCAGNTNAAYNCENVKCPLISQARNKFKRHYTISKEESEKRSNRLKQNKLIEP